MRRNTNSKKVISAMAIGLAAVLSVMSVPMTAYASEGEPDISGEAPTDPGNDGSPDTFEGERPDNDTFSGEPDNNEGSIRTQINTAIDMINQIDDEDPYDADISAEQFKIIALGELNEAQTSGNSANVIVCTPDGWKKTTAEELLMSADEKGKTVVDYLDDATDNLNNARKDLVAFVDANDAARNGLDSVIVTSENVDGSYSSDIVNKDELDQNINNADTIISSAENDVNTANNSDSEITAKTAAEGLDEQIKKVEAAIKNLDDIISKTETTISETSGIYSSSYDKLGIDDNTLSAVSAQDQLAATIEKQIYDALDELKTAADKVYYVENFVNDQFTENDVEELKFINSLYENLVSVEQNKEKLGNEYIGRRYSAAIKYAKALIRYDIIHREGVSDLQISGGLSFGDTTKCDVEYLMVDPELIESNDVYYKQDGAYKEFQTFDEIYNYERNERKEDPNTYYTTLNGTLTSPDFIGQRDNALVVQYKNADGKTVQEYYNVKCDRAGNWWYYQKTIDPHNIEYTEQNEQKQFMTVFSDDLKMGEMGAMSDELINFYTDYKTNEGTNLMAKKNAVLDLLIVETTIKTGIDTYKALYRNAQAFTKNGFEDTTLSQLYDQIDLAGTTLAGYKTARAALYARYELLKAAKIDLSRFDVQYIPADTDTTVEGTVEGTVEETVSSNDDAGDVVVNNDVNNNPVIINPIVNNLPAAVNNAVVNNVEEIPDEEAALTEAPAVTDDTVVEEQNTEDPVITTVEEITDEESALTEGPAIDEGTSAGFRWWYGLIAAMAAGGIAGVVAYLKNHKKEN